MLGSAISFTDPPPRRSLVRLCSKELSSSFHPASASFLSVGYSRLMLYFQLSKVSIACFRAAPTTYTFAPLSFRSRLSPQASAATKSVFPFFRGIKINASLTSSCSVPFL